MADIIELKDYKNKGNGAREAMKIALLVLDEMAEPPCLDCAVDLILAHMWIDGFKVVPVTEGDDAAEPTLFPGAPAS